MGRRSNANSFQPETAWKVPTEDEVYQHRNYLLSIAHARIWGDWEACDDIVQEAMLKTIIRLRRGPLVGEDSLKRFLAVVTENLCNDRNRLTKFQVKVTNTYLRIESSRDTEEEALVKLRLNQAWEFVSKLPPRQSRGILMKARGFTDQEAATQFGVLRASISCAVSRGRDSLAKMEAESVFAA